MAVFMLQTFAVERGASGRAADEEAARAHVAGRPSQIADALETEHRVVDVERQHRHVADRIAASPRPSTLLIAPGSVMPSCSTWPF